MGNPENSASLCDGFEAISPTTMSYTRKPLGDVASTVTSVLNTAASAVNKLTEVATDPYTPELVCRVGQIAAARGDRPVPVCTNTPLTYDDHMGFRKAMIPVRAYVYGEQHPWFLPAVGAAVVGLPLLLGYWLGKD